MNLKEEIANVIALICSKLNIITLNTTFECNYTNLVSKNII